MSKRHNLTKEKAALESTASLWMWKYITSFSHASTNKPHICCICNNMVARVDSCLKRHKFEGEEFNNLLERSKILTEQYTHDRLPAKTNNEIIVSPRGIDIPNNSQNVARMLENAIEFVKGDKRIVLWKLKNCDFKFYFNNHLKLLNDFEFYQINKYRVKVDQARQNKEVLSNFWKSIDPTFTIYPESALADANKIDDRFLFPKIDLLLKYNNLTTSEKDQMQREKKVPIQANTIKNRISLFERFIDFLEARQIFAGIHSKCFSMLITRCAEFKKKIKRS